MSHWCKGKVLFFDDKIGRGYIIDEDKNLWDVHYSAIISDKKWKTLKDGSLVKFKKLDDDDYMMVLSVKEAC